MALALTILGVSAAFGFGYVFYLPGDVLAFASEGQVSDVQVVDWDEVDGLVREDFLLSSPERLVATDKGLAVLDEILRRITRAM